MGQIRAATGGIASFFTLILIVILVCAGLSWFGYWLSGELSVPAGKAGVKIQNNDPNNQVTAQQNFLKDFTDIQGYENTIHHSLDQGSVELARQGCQQAVDDYDTMANGTTTKDWRPSDLPANIPISDCN